MLVDNGNTAVIAGVLRTQDSINKTGVAGLRSIPLLGALFRTRTKSSEREELLIFLTPRIVK